MNLLVGDRESWYPLHTHKEQRLDELPRPIFIRPAMRHYEVGGPFDEWRARADEWLSRRLKPQFPLRLSAFRTLLDFRVARTLYRAVRRLSRAFGDFVWRVMFEDFEDRDWIFGVLLVVALFGLLLVIVRP